MRFPRASPVRDRVRRRPCHGSNFHFRVRREPVEVVARFYTRRPRTIPSDYEFCIRTQITVSPGSYLCERLDPRASRDEQALHRERNVRDQFEVRVRDSGSDMGSGAIVQHVDVPLLLYDTQYEFICMA